MLQESQVTKRIAKKASVPDNTPLKCGNVQYRYQNVVTVVEETASNVNEKRVASTYLGKHRQNILSPTTDISSTYLA